MVATSPCLVYSVVRITIIITSLHYVVGDIWQRLAGKFLAQNYLPQCNKILKII
jgi:hypothetical protein